MPESPKWVAKRAAGTLHRPSIRELFSPELRRTTIVTTIMVACSYGVAFGAIQQLPQIVPGLDTVQAKVAAATRRPAAGATRSAIAGSTGTIAAANYTKAQEIGGLVGPVRAGDAGGADRQPAAAAADVSSCRGW